MVRSFNYSQYLKFILGITTLCMLGIYASYKYRLNDSFEEHRALLVHDAKYQLDYSIKDYKLIESQLHNFTRLLAREHMVYEYLADPEPQVKQELQSTWKAVLSSQRWFNQVNLIAIDGRELVVTSINDDGKAIHLSDDELTWFSNNIVLEEAPFASMDSVKIFGILVDPDLISEDKQALSRYARVYASYPIELNNERQAFVVAALDVEALNNTIKHSPLKYIHPEAVNRNGYFFASKNLDLLFGDRVLGREQFSLEVMYPKIWYAMQQEKEGVNIDGAMTIVHKRLDLGYTTHPLYFVVRISNELVHSTMVKQKKMLLSQSTSLVFLVLIFSFPLAFLIHQMKERSLDEKLAHAALDGMSAVIIADENDCIVRVNREYQNISGFSNRKVHGRDFKPLLMPDETPQLLAQRESDLEQHQVWQGEVKALGEDGRHFHVQVREQRGVETKGVGYTILSLIDITAQKSLEEKLLYLSEHDSLTKIWNRRKFDTELARYAMLKQRYPIKEPVSLAILDIDFFKKVNDQYGHDVGDEVLKSVAQFFTSQLRTTDLVARVGGEEFGLIMPYTSIEDANTVLERLRVELSQHETIKPNVTISIGITNMGESAEETYKRADSALYQSKENGRNRITTILL